MRAFVDPPMAWVMIRALRNERGVMSSLGRGPPSNARETAFLPLASAERRRSACVAGIDAERGSSRPIASTMQANIVEESGAWFYYNGDRVGKGGGDATTSLRGHP